MGNRLGPTSGITGYPANTSEQVKRDEISELLLSLGQEIAHRQSPLPTTQRQVTETAPPRATPPLRRSVRLAESDMQSKASTVNAAATIATPSAKAHGGTSSKRKWAEVSGPIIPNKRYAAQLGDGSIQTVLGSEVKILQALEHSTAKSKGESNDGWQKRVSDLLAKEGCDDKTRYRLLAMIHDEKVDTIKGRPALIRLTGKESQKAGKIRAWKEEQSAGLSVRELCTLAFKSLPWLRNLEVSSCLKVAMVGLNASKSAVSAARAVDQRTQAAEKASTSTKP